MNLIKQKFIVSILMLFAAGCAQNKYAKTIDQLCPDSIDKVKALTISEKVLSDMHFRIEKSDIDAGYIRTIPLTGAQSFELWRNDNVGSFNQMEANLQNIRRSVEINLTQQENKICINCQANVQRLSMPHSQTGSNQDIVMSREQRSIYKFKLNPDQKASIKWIDLGRDNQLETEILKRIEKKL